MQIFNILSVLNALIRPSRRYASKNEKNFTKKLNFGYYLVDNRINCNYNGIVK